MIWLARFFYVCFTFFPFLHTPNDILQPSAHSIPGRCNKFLRDQLFSVENFSPISISYRIRIENSKCQQQHMRDNKWGQLLFFSTTMNLFFLKRKKVQKKININTIEKFLVSLNAMSFLFFLFKANTIVTETYYTFL